MTPDRNDPSIGDASGSAAELPAAVRRRFVAIVILLNVGILAVSLGVMLAIFRARYRDGAILVVAGGGVLVSAYWRYRTRHEVFEAAS